MNLTTTGPKPTMLKQQLHVHNRGTAATPKENAMHTSTRNRLATLVLASLSIAGIVAGTANAALVSVNFEQYTPSLGTFEVESTLVGPAGGLGTEWNQYADEDSTGVMVDSTGAPTTVTFTTNFSEGRSGGGGNTPMLRSTLTDFGRGQQRRLTIDGLVVDGRYNIWLTSFRDSTSEVERTVGTWSTPNSTKSPISQIIDNRPGRNGTTFVDGYNYVLFEKVIADASGQIVFDGQGLIIDLPISNNDYRLGLSGFQILEVPEPATALLAGLGLLGVCFRRRLSA